MNRFLLGALAMGAVFVLTSFALSTRLSSAAATTGPAWTVSQYQLDRAFRMSGLTGSNSFVMPATGGIIITEVRLMGNLDPLTISVNGVAETFKKSYTGGNADFPTEHLNPPIIARPGDTVSFSTGGSGATFAIAGYTTLPGET